MLQPDGAGFAAYLEGEPVDAEIRGARGDRSRLGGVGGARWSGNGSTRGSGPWCAPAGTWWWTAGTSVPWCFPTPTSRSFSPRRPRPARAGGISQRGGAVGRRRGWRPRPLHWRPGTRPTRPGRSPRSRPARRRRPARHHRADLRRAGPARSWSWPGRSSAAASKAGRLHSSANCLSHLALATSPCYPTRLPRRALRPVRHSSP